MAAADCIAEVAKLLGRKIGDDEAEEIFSNLHQAMMRRRRGNEGESIADSYAKAAELFEAENVALAVIEKRNAAINAQVRLINEDFIVSQFIDNAALGFEASLVGVNASRPGARRSVNAEQRALFMEYARGMVADVERVGLWRDFISGELDLEIYRALWKLGDEVEGAPRAPTAEIAGRPVSREAEQLAEIVHKWQEKARLDANKAGSWIRSLPGYIVRQSHDMFKIRRGGFDAWRDFITERLHPRTFDDVGAAGREIGIASNVRAPGSDRIGQIIEIQGEQATVRFKSDEGIIETRTVRLELLQNAEGRISQSDFLEEVYAGLSSGVHLANAEGAAVPRGQGGSIAKRMSQDRVLHFKDADAAYEYNLKFGGGSLREALMFGFERTSQQTGMMRIWGTNPHNNFDQVWQRVLKRLDGEGRDTLNRRRGALDNRMAEVDGSINIPANVMLAKYGSVIRALQSMAKLGGATLSAISDIPIFASELRYQGIPFFESYAAALRSLTRGRGSAEIREIAAAIGIHSDGMVGSMIHRMSGQDDLPGWTSRMMRTYFKWNLLTPWTDGMRTGAGLAMSNNLARKAGIVGADLDAPTKRVLGLFGIDDGKWDMMRRAGVRRAEGQDFMIPEGARDIPASQLKAYLESRGQTATDARIRDLRLEVEQDFRSYYTDRIDYAVINPDARTNAILRQGLQPGTPMGEAIRFWAQFKSFPTAVLHKSVGREVFGRGADLDIGVFRALRSGNGEFAGMMSFIVQTGIFGYIAMSAKDMVKGREPRDVASIATWFAAITQGGGAGIYGDFLFGEARNRFGQSALDTFLGPTFGTATDIYDIYGAARDGDLKAAKVFNTLLNNTPFANLFYTRIAMDYAFLYELRESMSPGFARRMERRISEQNGQEFFLRPSEFVR